MRFVAPLVALALLALAVLPSATPANAEFFAAPAQGNLKIAPPLLARMTADPLALEAVIVEMDHAVAPFGEQPNAQLARQALALIAQQGQPVGALPIVGAAAGWVPAAGIQALSLLPGVAYIHDDAAIRPRPNASHGPAWPAGQLGSLYPREIHADQVWTQSRGSGIGVAVLDSGVAADADLGNRVLASISFAGPRSTLGDGGGHGTHVAGIIGGDGTRSQGEYVGVAPQVNIVDVQVLDERGSGRLSSVIGGLGWVVAHRQEYNLRVANLSFGAPAPPSYHADLLSSAVELAWKQGIVVVTAAGNAGPTRGSVETPGIDPYAITVGAIDDQATLAVADDVLGWFSSWGTPVDGQPKPDLVAPGRKIVSLRVPGSLLDQHLGDHVVTAKNGASYFRLTGTSQACAVVSGAIALVLQRHPEYTPDQVKMILLRTTQWYGGVSQLADPSAAGAGLLDAYAAFSSSSRGFANAGLRPADGAARRLFPLLFGQSLVWKDPLYRGMPWSAVNWTTIAWDNIAWDNIAWDSFNYSNIAWDNIAWDNIAWDNIAWDRANWDNIAWDNIAWD
ncbi:MAG TPA: S8 family peptidase [Chloroflexota bacterium]|jgi:serine protease AprX|nr:S8 family peptidase [Chloroflexota bacterium]